MSLKTPSLVFITNEQICTTGSLKGSAAVSSKSVSSFFFWVQTVPVGSSLSGVPMFTVLPVVQIGPFVMNTREVYETYRDYRDGVNGFEREYVELGWCFKVRYGP
ncbi:hypothetical protein K457DRAFT_23887 [Linnemannia elongata AG-77]|uniref:Uncharacterized protein n=1 Tax=Linnemannia elongata AG-77 TaxID=1314771 RepID=A0A197JHI7_9FUNG|nr:hypothetical protein K457DRAFT_23887 [Linnemannia elongata AG-77]